MSLYRLSRWATGAMRPPALALLVAASCALVVPAATAATHHGHGHAKHKHNKHKSKHKHKTKHKKQHTTSGSQGATAAPTTSRTTTTTQQCTPGQPGAPTAATQAFWTHLQTAHLGESPAQQVADIAGNLDGWTKTHTVLVSNMLDPSVTDVEQLPVAFQQLAAIFEAHIDQAHLEPSPAAQVQALVGDPDGYARLHTAWIEMMLEPLQAWEATYLDGTPASCQAVTTTQDQSTPPPAPATQAVAISGHAFSPKDVTVAKGTTVTWTNDDTDPHTVASMHGGPLGSKTLEKGDTYAYTFDQAGTYMYYCSIHPDMQGTVTVR